MAPAKDPGPLAGVTPETGDDLHMNEDGEIVPLYRGMDYRLSGEFHMASLRRKVDIVSNQCMMVRSSLESCTDKDSGRMCRKIRDRGYRIVIDPQAVFLKK